MHRLLPFLVTSILAASGCVVNTPAEPDVPLPDAPFDAPPACEGDTVRCGMQCVTLNSDSRNCGECGNVCLPGSSCAAGRCDCMAPMLACDGVCIDLTSDAAHCGSCDRACGAGEDCFMGECLPACPTDTPDRCGTGAESTCVSFDLDPSNCGDCGIACIPGTLCVDGVCACPSGLTSCGGGTCVDTRSDPANCGGCLASCGDGGTCVDGACTSCGGGLTPCGDPARCYDTDTSRLHCGACGRPCGGGEACRDGLCECLGSLVDCGDGCTDLMTTRTHCGDCATDCGPTGVCVDGSCTCAPGDVMCGRECANLMTNREHCSACDTPCPPTEVCIGGACAEAPLYHGWTSPLAGCVTDRYDSTSSTALGGTYPYLMTDTPACRAWKLAATVCTTPPTAYFGTDNWTCPVSGGFTDPVFGTYCRPPGDQYACSTCPAACNAGPSCSYMPLSLRDCDGNEVEQL